MLSDDTHPDKQVQATASLVEIHQQLVSFEFPFPVTAELRPNQITIEIADKFQWKKVKPIIVQLVSSRNKERIRILESTHSMDLIDTACTSKLRIIDACTEVARQKHLKEDSLCIGDRGQWPGNDYLLLSHKYSLSVDEASSLNDSCWNLCPPGIRNVEGTLHYLEKLVFRKGSASIVFP
jgi:hypothetical protein